MVLSSSPVSSVDDDCGQLPFYSILSLHCRSHDGQLLRIEGRHSQVVARHWPIIFEHLKSSEATLTRLTSQAVVETRSFDLTSEEFVREVGPPQDHVTIRSREVYQDASGYFVGLLCVCTDESSNSAFREWIETFIVSYTSLKPPGQLKGLQAPNRRNRRNGWHRRWSTARIRNKPTKGRSDESSARDCASVAEHITRLFERMLRNVACQDEWHITGRAHFFRLVLDFVSRNEACQMVLPAFPCKSPNRIKVANSDPDMAEQIALETLRDFVRAVRKIYNPGATICIIHDGHLLSSCIGVDDEDISKYEASLWDLYRSVAGSPEDRDAVKFATLTDLFFPPGRPDDLRKTLDEAWLDDPGILIHPLPTELSPEAEVARKLVMASCSIGRARLRSLIKEQDAATLRTYRGLSRFMLKDLPTTAKPQSTSQRKKTAATVAAEMMARNQAYSNLVELLFPDYVRLSIHAHNNRGPKFGVRLFPRDRVRPVDSLLLDDRSEPNPVYEFQIPTPWHNSIVMVVGDDVAYLTRADVARQALEGNLFSGGWVAGDDASGRGGGYFLLREKDIRVISFILQVLESELI
ncbi:Pyoverdine/dityrosine biosynthesis protein-domain-containing protein [Xylariaceae sp. FL1272]|nr:Pyoverdine/dityrosine biosynthesis protein-domain-containing protein [Xylariaceae sp. FL1272]